MRPNSNWHYQTPKPAAAKTTKKPAKTDSKGGKVPKGKIYIHYCIDWEAFSIVILLDRHIRFTQNRTKRAQRWEGCFLRNFVISNSLIAKFLSLYLEPKGPKQPKGENVSLLAHLLFWTVLSAICSSLLQSRRILKKRTTMVKMRRQRRTSSCEAKDWLLCMLLMIGYWNLLYHKSTE